MKRMPAEAGIPSNRGLELSPLVLRLVGVLPILARLLIGLLLALLLFALLLRALLLLTRLRGILLVG